MDDGPYGTDDQLDDQLDDQQEDIAYSEENETYSEETANYARDDTNGEDGYPAESDDVNVMDTQTGDVITMEGEVCGMDMESVDVGCKDSPPLPDKAARDQEEDAEQLKDSEKDEYLQRTPEKLKLPKDGTWHNQDAQQPAEEEKAPPIPIKRGNTKKRIEMFESM